MLASKNPAEQIQGQADQLLARCYEAENSPAAQTPITDELEKLDHAHAESIFLTTLRFNLSRETSTPELGQRLLTLASETMNNFNRRIAESPDGQAGAGEEQELIAGPAEKPGLNARKSRPTGTNDLYFKRAGRCGPRPWPLEMVPEPSSTLPRKCRGPAGWFGYCCLNQVQLKGTSYGNRQ